MGHVASRVLLLSMTLEEVIENELMSATRCDLGRSLEIWSFAIPNELQLFLKSFNQRRSFSEINQDLNNSLEIFTLRFCRFENSSKDTDLENIYFQSLRRCIEFSGKINPQITLGDERVALAALQDSNNVTWPYEWLVHGKMRRDVREQPHEYWVCSIFIARP